MRYSTVTPNGFRENGFTPRQAYHDPPPLNAAIYRHSHVQQRRQPRYKDYSRHYEEHCLFVDA